MASKGLTIERLATFRDIKYKIKRKKTIARYNREKNRNCCNNGSIVITSASDILACDIRISS